MRRETESPRRLPGRPKANEPGTTVCAWLKQHEHDRLIRLANDRDTSVSSLVRQLLIKRLP